MAITLVGPPFRQSYSLLENCFIIANTSLIGHIMVECAYPNDSTATGFQMIAQLSNLTEVHRLYANKTTDCQTPASVVVEENGMYQVTIFAIRGRRGIVDSHVEYSRQITVDNITKSDVGTTRPEYNITDITSDNTVYKPTTGMRGATLACIKQ